ncbi:MAG TPA: hypothetical protein VHO03_11625 [Ignavibacteriales bacterium]|nr:hypothetical protein [Ignavibacteriales bacterium]
MQNKYSLTLVVLLFTLLFSAGCQKKQEQQQPQQKQADTTAVKDTAKKADTTTAKAAQQSQAADLKGTWRGTFDQRPTTLKITEQNGNDFKGNITINYRQVINQQVNGTFDPATKRLTMKDLLHSRFMGKYAGKVSDDMKKFSGTFTMTADGSKFNFNLAKK